jgi:hypothetical protein
VLKAFYMSKLNPAAIGKRLKAYTGSVYRLVDIGLYKNKALDMPQVRNGRFIYPFDGVGMSQPR